MNLTSALYHAQYIYSIRVLSATRTAAPPTLHLLIPSLYPPPLDYHIYIQRTRYDMYLLLERL
jgi:hypothetical protein